MPATVQQPEIRPRIRCEYRKINQRLKLVYPLLLTIQSGRIAVPLMVPRAERHDFATVELAIPIRTTVDAALEIGKSFW